ncbi:formimidoylglutamase [Altibacter sp.]|uniref:formimidoylglutamase n=1 Tax=Altibacter sp. TaxID=2024823 RepID=UPI000C8E4C1A|nr:formimidoylglutamase [Altibacter sp.]MAP55267.1 arginase [Altibacter sp.]
MSTVTFYAEDEVRSLVNKRDGEVKFGEVLSIAHDWQSLQNSKHPYVLLGIPEDIGVRANFGISGTSQAWTQALRVLCNIQQNEFTQAEKVLLLGEIDCRDEVSALGVVAKDDALNTQQLGALVSNIDTKVAEAVAAIIKTGKIPILVGGGHNNSYGNLNGASTALGGPLNCINFDAHTDFRALEHRHSGNGFSYAYNEGYLEKYFVFGLHRNYTSQSVFDTMKKHKDRIQFALFDSLLQDKGNSFEVFLQKADTFCGQKPFGLELDMDAIAEMGSSAQSPSGFSVTEARHFLRYFSKKEHCIYIHICEGNPKTESFPNQVAKTIAYFISDVLSGETS